MVEVKDDSVESQADEIAKKLIVMLAEGFRKKSGREPTKEEVEELMSELTEERLTALLSGEEEISSVNGIEAKDGDEEEEEKEAETAKEKEVETAKEKEVETAEGKENIDVKKDKENADVNGDKIETSEIKNIGEKRAASEAVEPTPEIMTFKWPKVDAV